MEPGILILSATMRTTEHAREVPATMGNRAACHPVDCLLLDIRIPGEAARHGTINRWLRILVVRSDPCVRVRVDTGAFLDLRHQSAANNLWLEDWLGLLIDREVQPGISKSAS
jgi:hypothetical protein